MSNEIKEVLSRIHTSIDRRKNILLQRLPAINEADNNEIIGYDENWDIKRSIELNLINILEEIS